MVFLTPNHLDFTYLDLFTSKVTFLYIVSPINPLQLSIFLHQNEFTIVFLNSETLYLKYATLLSTYLIQKHQKV